MPKTRKKPDPQIQLAKEVKELTKEMGRLKSLDYMQVFRKPVKFMWFAFLKGLMVGFGSVLGASVLVGIFVYIMARISFVPIIGGFVEDVIEQLGASQGTDQTQQENPFYNQYQQTRNNIENGS